jgi:hypothetical protein
MSKKANGRVACECKTSDPNSTGAWFYVFGGFVQVCIRRTDGNVAMADIPVAKILRRIPRTGDRK